MGCVRQVSHEKKQMADFLKGKSAILCLAPHVEPRWRWEEDLEI